MKLHQDKWENPKMIKYILTMFVFGTFLMASDYSQSETKPTPTITINDDSEKTNARRRGGKGNKGRRRGGSGLR